MTEDSAWRRTNPEARARAEATVAQLRSSIEQLEKRLDKAQNAGRDKEGDRRENAGTPHCADDQREECEHEENLVSRADEDENPNPRSDEGESARREAEDREYAQAVTEKLKELFPGCPPEEAERIAAWTCRKHSGRGARRLLTQCAPRRDSTFGMVFMTITVSRSRLWCRRYQRSKASFSVA